MVSPSEPMGSTNSIIVKKLVHASSHIAIVFLLLIPFSDWSEHVHKSLKISTLSIDGAFVNPHMFCLFGQVFVSSRADQKPLTWEYGRI